MSARRQSNDELSASISDAAITKKHFYFANTDSSFNISIIRQNNNTAGALFTIDDTPTSPSVKTIKITALADVDIDIKAFEFYTGAAAGVQIDFYDSAGTALMSGAAYFEASSGPGGGYAFGRLRLSAGDFISIGVNASPSGTFVRGGLNVVAEKISNG